MRDWNSIKAEQANINYGEVLGGGGVEASKSLG